VRGKDSVANSGKRAGITAGAEAWSLPAARPAGQGGRLGRCVVEVLVVANMPIPYKMGLLGTASALLGVFGYLLGTRWVGGTTIVVSAAILGWMRPY
jgi:hypothetical protein